ncbi:MAG: NTP transferase domain-containing protein [candidate division Zixibacteria bacterium]|nr:NTP transferase domain-containing protein [candidate division Zixibacteria bacterium]
MTTIENSITAVVLAGGKGTRLMPETDETPKPLMPVGGRPVVEILLKQMQRTGVKTIRMAVNHLAEKIESALGDGSKLGLQISYSHEEKPLSTVGPLKLINNLPEHFIVANADVITDLNFEKLFKQHLESKSDLTIASYERHSQADYGVLSVDESGQVVGFNEKPVFNFIVSMGIYVFSKKILDFVPADTAYGFDSLMYELLDKGAAINSYPYDGYWLDIGRHDDYDRANNDVEKIKYLLE